MWSSVSISVNGQGYHGLNTDVQFSVAELTPRPRFRHGNKIGEGFVKSLNLKGGVNPENFDGDPSNAVVFIPFGSNIVYTPSKLLKIAESCANQGAASVMIQLQNKYHNMFSMKLGGIFSLDDWIAELNRSGPKSLVENNIIPIFLVTYDVGSQICVLNRNCMRLDISIAAPARSHDTIFDPSFEPLLPGLSTQLAPIFNTVPNESNLDDIVTRIVDLLDRKDTWWLDHPCTNNLLTKWSYQVDFPLVLLIALRLRSTKGVAVSTFDDLISCAMRRQVYEYGWSQT